MIVILVFVLLCALPVYAPWPELRLESYRSGRPHCFVTISMESVWRRGDRRGVPIWVFSRVEFQGTGVIHMHYLMWSQPPYYPLYVDLGLSSVYLTVDPMLDDGTVDEEA